MNVKNKKNEKKSKTPIVVISFLFVNIFTKMNWMGLKLDF